MGDGNPRVVMPLIWEWKLLIPKVSYTSKTVNPDRYLELLEYRCVAKHVANQC